MSAEIWLAAARVCREVGEEQPWSRSVWVAEECAKRLEEVASQLGSTVASGHCEDCGDLRWCCKASKERHEREVLIEERRRVMRQGNPIPCGGSDE